MSDESSTPAPTPSRPPRRLPGHRSFSGGGGARTYVIGAIILFVIPGLVGGAVWWLYAQKAAVDRAFMEPLREFKGHESVIDSVAFSPNGRRALSGSYDETLRLWDLGTGETVREFKGHTDGVFSVVLMSSARSLTAGM